VSATNAEGESSTETVTYRVVSTTNQFTAGQPRADAAGNIHLTLELPGPGAIAVVADDALRATRIAARDQAALASREARQLPQAEKARRATYVVVNDGTVEELRAALAGVLDQLVG